MRYPDKCQSAEERDALLGNIADQCREFLKSDKWWPPYKEETLLELMTKGKLTRYEYDYLVKMQRRWEEYYRKNEFSKSPSIQDLFRKAYNYRDW